MIRSSAIAVLLSAMALVLLVLGAVHRKAGNSDLIHHRSFADFIRGTPGNSGVNLYVPHHGGVEVINQWDLNGDGYNDVVISNDHNDFEIVDAFVYWNSPSGFRSLLPPLWREMPLAQVAFDLMDGHTGVTRLPAFGGGRSVIADLNGDGHADIVFCNYIHNYPGLRNAYVYWGSAKGYSVSNRTELPTIWAGGVAAADLNRDGYPELIFANHGAEAGLEEISRDAGQDSYIYWGSAKGYDAQRRSLLTTRGAADIAAADINGDGFLDLAFINNGPRAKDVQVFWGGSAGYTNSRSQALPLPEPNSIRAGDVNKDGYADLIVTTSTRSQTINFENAGKAAGDRAVHVLLGGADGLSSRRVVLLPSYEAHDTAVGDFNRDGLADIAIANFSSGSGAVVPSFVYWGSAKGFSPDRRTELPTLAANGVAAADLNGDGLPDLVFANSNDEKSHDVPSYIYWGSSTGYAPYLRSTLQTFGAASVNTADLNGDGRPEIVFVNQYSGAFHGNVNTNIFWGNPDHYYSTASMTSLPGHGAYDTTAADLNQDGYPDLVLANSYIETSYLYWGGPDGFSPSRKQDLPTGRVFTSSAADLNRDGYLDLVFAGSARSKMFGGIFWGSAAGYSESRKTVLPLKTRRGSTNAIADLNRDGYLDLIFPDDYFGNMQIFWGGPDGYADARSWSRFVSGGHVQLADLNGDGRLDFVVTGTFDASRKSYNTKTRIFWGTAGGTPSFEGVVELEAYGAIECAIADLNRDGNLDLALSNYMSDTTRSLPAYIYWGEKGGHYSNSRRTELPAESSAGIQALDLNRDGFPELIIHNHLKDGRHSINSYIYWNGPNGFSPERRTELPNFGPHYSQSIDPGNLYTRRLEEDYISAPIQIPPGGQPGSLSWKANEPHGSQMRFQVRFAPTPESLSKAEWRGPQGTASFFTGHTASISGMEREDRWMQYRAVFASPDGSAWPSLSEVSVQLR